MLPVTQIDTFFKGLTLRHRDTINAAAGGTFMKRHLKECYDLIKNITAHHNDWDTSAQWSESSSSITSSFDTEIAALKAEMAEINKNLMRVLQPSLATLKTYMLEEPIKANDDILKNMQTNMTSLTNSNLELKNMFGQFMKMNTASSSGSRTLPGPTIPTTTSSSPAIERETEATKDIMHPTNNGSTKDVQPPVVLTESPILNSEPVVSQIIEPVASPVSAPRPNQRPSISFADALILIPKFGPSIKSLLTNKDKLSLVGLGTSINLMPLSVWNKLSLPGLSSMCMTLELPDRLISRPVGVAEDVFVKVGTFHFLADFVFIDFDVDPRVPLILGRSFLKTGRALIDVFEGKLTLHVGKEAITFNLDQTSRYSASYNDMTANRNDVIDMACEEYSQEVLEAFLNDDPSLSPPNQGNYLPEVRKELKICEAKSDKYSIDEPPEVELKDLPPHLKYVFLEGDDKLPVIIAKDLSVEEKIAFIT
nr:hypothetical protein [Tanacetum cinerariifolium]